MKRPIVFPHYHDANAETVPSPISGRWSAVRGTSVLEQSGPLRSGMWPSRGASVVPMLSLVREVAYGELDPKITVGDPAGLRL